MYQAVIFDLGGVVLGSPLHEIARWERDRSLPPGLVARVVSNAGPDGAWQRHERGEIGYEVFRHDLGAELGVPAASVDELMDRIRAVATPRPAMVHAVAVLRAHGLRVAALTNNWRDPAAEDDRASLRDRFDVFVESWREGVRKPEPEIYRRTLDRLAVAPGETVFLDDIGANLKPAAALGMTTVKVTAPARALHRLEELLGLSFPAAATPRGIDTVPGQE